MLEIAGKSPFYARGLCFSCIRCSACCRHESGYVFLSQEDVARLRAAVNMGYNEFIAAYCRWIPAAGGCRQLSLKEKSNYDCIFWIKKGREGGCSVYETRPLQCRAFPFWSTVVSSQSSWKATAADCPGMGRGVLHSRDSIEKWLAQRQKEPIIEDGPKT